MGFPKTPHAGVYMDWASSAPFLHLSLVTTFPDLPDAHDPKPSLCLSLAQLISCHGQLLSTLPPARLLIPTCFLSSAREAVLPPEDASSPQRLSQDVGLGHPRDFAPAVSCTLQRPHEGASSATTWRFSASDPVLTRWPVRQDRKRDLWKQG